VSEYARGAFGIAGGKAEEIEIAFDASMAGYIRERVWHESQALEDRPDGSIVLRMSVAPGFELVSWIKGFLPHARVLRPATLREQIAHDLRLALEASAQGRS
jgi:predicted DNA-binding transcriptional regulator YafY